MTVPPTPPIRPRIHFDPPAGIGSSTTRCAISKTSGFKSTTVTNYAQIGQDLVEFISDTTPAKQGKFTPGMHIPVKPYQDFKTNYPDYALLLAWNHGEEIIANEQEYLRQGGKFITFVPQVEIRE